MTQMYCYVADLLGFKKMVLNLPNEQQADRVKNWIQLVSKGASKFEIKKYKLVSDTIFAVTKGDEDGLENLLNFSKYMLERGTRKSFLLRGAISYGDVTWNKHIPYGKAIVDAFNHSNKQDWIGTSLRPNIISDKSSLWASKLIINYVIPFKKGDVYVLPAIIWDVPIFEDLLTLSTGGGLFPGEANKFNEFDFSHFSKIQNTQIFSHYVRIVMSRKCPLNAIYGSQPLEMIIDGGKNIEKMQIEIEGKDGVYVDGQ